MAPTVETAPPDQKGVLTPRDHRAIRQTADFLLGEAFGMARQASIIAASLALPDPFLQPYTKARP
ncbi:MAG: hypothetical protein CMM31_00615, partial [Rhodospirillaceae bacterium]|nr:hypothetical protein [Rhodospirillaceae bacterium]